MALSISQQRDSLFPALTRVQQTHPTLPFNFPELLLRPERPLTLYRDETLDSHHPLFSELNRLIACLEEGSEVRAAYTSYVEEVCQAQGKSRWRLLKGEARLIFGDDCFFIPRKLGREIVSEVPFQGDSLRLAAGVVDHERPLIKLENTWISGERMGRTFCPSSPLPKPLRGWLDALLPATGEALKFIDLLCSSSVSMDLTFKEALLDSHLNLARALAPGAALPSQLPLLLEAVVNHGSPEAFSLLADLGAPIEGSLHLMAEKGRSDLIALLSERLGDRFNVDQRGAMGRTALHIAALHGNVDAAGELLKRGASLFLVDEDGKSALHLAIHPKPTFELVELFLGTLTLDQRQQLLSLGDKDGKTPLHLSLWQEDSRIVDLLIHSGSHVNGANHYGYTALHWAAKHRLTASAQLLLQAGANPLVLNQNQESPLSLALRYEADEVARLLLFYPLDLDAPEIFFGETTNRERALQEVFIQAFQRESLQEQIFSLAKQAFLALEGERPDYWKAVLLLNSACAIAQKLSPQCEDLLIHQLEQVEHSFIRHELGRAVEYHGRIKEYRARLKSIRDGVDRSLKQRSPIDAVQLELTQSYKEVLSDLFNDCIEILGASPPTRFAMVGLGSMSRNEMCPYSDIEFIFLVEEDSKKTRSYFRSITRLMVLKIANFGETDYELPTFMEGGRFIAQSLTPSGFKMDSALSPLGQRGVHQKGAHELIGTPSRLAGFQADNDKGIILLNAMTTSCLIEGHPDLLRAYQVEVAEILDSTTPSQQKRREERALELIKWDVIEYAPQLNQEKIESRLFGIKKELYRFPQSLINALAIYHGVKSTNAFQRIDRLQEKGVFSITGANQLKRLFRSTLKMRTETHLFYENEQEVFYHSRGEYDPEAKGLFVMTPDLTREITELYRILIPLHQRAQEFLNGNANAFSNRSFYDKEVGSYDDKLRQELQFEAALGLATSSVALDPNNLPSRWGLGYVQSDLGQAWTAANNFEEALRLSRRKHNNQPHLDLIISLNNLSSAYLDLGNYQNAIEHLEEALSIGQQIYRDCSHPRIATSLNNLGEAYKNLGQYLLAVQYHQQSLAIHKKTFGDHPNSKVAMSLSNLGEAYLFLGQYKDGIQYHRQALDMREQIHKKKPHPDLAMSLNNLGAAYHRLNDYGNAIDFHNQALDMRQQIYGNRPHPDVAKSLNNLGGIYKELGQYSLAIKHHQQSLDIYTEFYGEHPDTATSLNNLGNIYDDLSDYKQAIEYHQKALTMRKHIYNNKAHPDIAVSLNNLGSVYRNLRDYQSALAYYQASFAIHKQIHGDRPHVSVATSLNNLGEALHNLNQYKDAITHLDDSFNMMKQLIGDQPHSNIATSLHNLGNVYSTLGQHEVAIGYFQQSLNIERQIHRDQPHPNIAKSLTSLGSAYNRSRQYDLAISSQNQALEMFKRIYGDRPHPDIAGSLMSLGLACNSSHQYRFAIDFQKQGLEMFKLIHEDRPHRDVAASLSCLGVAHSSLGEHDLAIDLQKQAFDMFRQIHGDQLHLDVILSLNHLSNAYSSSGDYPKAIELLQNLYDSFRQGAGTDDPNTNMAKENLDRAIKAMNAQSQPLP